MSKTSIIPAPSTEGGTGGIMLLFDAVEQFPDARIVLYNRVSSWNQAGKGKAKLEAKTYAVVRDVRDIAPGKLRQICRGVEEGKLSKPRRTLLEAAADAAKKGMILVASDLSRFIRAEEYHRWENPDAWPSPDEFALLRKLTRGAVLATVWEPDLTESDRQQLATMSTGKHGRPSKVDYATGLAILKMLGFPDKEHGTTKWSEGMMSLGFVARRLSIPKARVQRFVDSDAPLELTDGKKMRWKDLYDPARAYRIAYKKGLLRNVSKPE